MQHILILDDEEDILKLLSFNLEREGYKVFSSSHPSSFFTFLEHSSNKISLIILDVMLPFKDGITILRELKNSHPDIPVIILTAKDDVVDKVIGLEFGAEDYITKPFSIKELIARIKVVFRRNIEKNEEEKVKKVRFDEILLDNEKHECRIDGKIVDLTNTEFKILDLFLSRKGFVFTREKLLTYLWGDDKIVIDRTIDVHIKNLRTKIGIYGKNIQNIRGVGYKFVE